MLPWAVEVLLGLLGCCWGQLGCCEGVGGCWGLSGCCWELLRCCQSAAGSCRGAPCLLQLLFSPRQLEQFKADNQDIGFGSGTRALEQALEKTRANINWVKENQQTVLDWFKNQTNSS